MPLIHSSSDAAFKSNLKAEMAAGKPQKQALAIAYSVKRRGRAFGGFSPYMVKPSVNRMEHAEARNMMHSPAVHVGPINSAVAGRTDHHPMSVKAGSYVLPADHVSSLGQGNTAAGMKVLGNMFGHQGPYGAGATMGIKHGAGPPRAPRLQHAAGGASDRGGARDRHDGSPVPIAAAGGEYVIDPEIVQSIGGGDIKHGHAILDNWVVENRKKHVKTLKKLPGPAKS